MKKITLLIALFTIAIVSAQTTHDVTWQQGTTNSNVTIDVGDTVRWTWGNTGSHNLVPAPGENDAPSDFGVPNLVSQMGFVYEYTFTTPAEIDYQCDPHSNSMFGKIIVEEILSLDDKFVLNLRAFPNPVIDVFTIESLVPVDRYAVYNVLGTKIIDQAGNGISTEVDLSNVASGIYLINVSAGEASTTLKLIKK